MEPVAETASREFTPTAQVVNGQFDVPASGAAGTLGEWRRVLPEDRLKVKCQGNIHHGCGDTRPRRRATWCYQWRTAAMAAPAFWYFCDEGRESMELALKHGLMIAPAPTAALPPTALPSTWVHELDALLGDVSSSDVFTDAPESQEAVRSIRSRARAWRELLAVEDGR